MNARTRTFLAAAALVMIGVAVVPMQSALDSSPAHAGGRCVTWPTSSTTTTSTTIVEVPELAVPEKALELRRVYPCPPTTTTTTTTAPTPDTTEPEAEPESFPETPGPQVIERTTTETVVLVVGAVVAEPTFTG